MITSIDKNVRIFKYKRNTVYPQMVSLLNTFLPYFAQPSNKYSISFPILWFKKVIFLESYLRKY